MHFHHPQQGMLIYILITLFFVFLNGFFVAAEFAIVKVRSSQLELKAQAGNRSAILSKHIVEHLDAYLAATQLGITLASLALGWIGEPVVSKLIIGFMQLFDVSISESVAYTISLPIAFIIITILHIVFGELAPKSLAIQRSEQTALFVAYPLQLFYWICRPVIWTLNGFANFILKLVGLHSVSEQESYTSDELKYLINQAKGQSESDNIVEEAKYDIIKNAFEFSERTARQIMVPRTQMVAIDINDYDKKTIEYVIEESFSRIPCYEDSIDNIVGVVYLKDILKSLRQDKPLDIKPLIRPISFIPESKRIVQQLKEFQIKRQQIAIVLNEYGGVEGIITMEDILEELVGEIQDESDNETPFVEQTDKDTYSILATSALNDINNELPHSIDKEKQYDTLAGYLIDKFGRIPGINEKLEAEGYEFTILNKNKTSIILVQARDLTFAEETEAEETKETDK